MFANSCPLACHSIRNQQEELLPYAVSNVTAGMIKMMSLKFISKFSLHSLTLLRVIVCINTVKHVHVYVYVPNTSFFWFSFRTEVLELSYSPKSEIQYMSLMHKF